MPTKNPRPATSTKDLALNYLPVSLGLRDGAVVPLREVVVEEDLHGVFEALRVLAAGGVDLVEEADRHAQASTRLGLLDELLGDLHGVEDHPLAGPCDVREHPVLDRV